MCDVVVGSLRMVLCASLTLPIGVAFFFKKQTNKQQQQQLFLAGT